MALPAQDSRATGSWGQQSPDFEPHLGPDGRLQLVTQPSKTRVRCYSSGRKPWASKASIQHQLKGKMTRCGPAKEARVSVSCTGPRPAHCSPSPLISLEGMEARVDRGTLNNLAHKDQGAQVTEGGREGEETQDEHTHSGGLTPFLGLRGAGEDAGRNGHEAALGRSPQAPPTPS